MSHNNNNDYNNYYHVQNGGNAEYREALYAPRGPVRKKRTAPIIISLCLVCLLLGGAIGVGAYQIAGMVSGITVNAPQLSTIEADSGNETPNSTNLVAAPYVKAGYTGQPLSASEIYATVINSCVGITTPYTTTNIFGQTISNAISGSGFIISEDGYIVTNYHVIEAASMQNLEITVSLYNGDEYPAKIVGTESANDVALLKIEANNLQPVVLGTLEDMYVGDDVYAIGNPLGMLTWTMTEGIVSAFEREIGEPNPINMLQISAAINSGNSGGPVFNDRGEVIGIATAKYSSNGVEGLGFAIPIDDVRPMIDDFRQYGYVRGKAHFGITVTTSRDTVPGCVVVEVDAGGCASKAGLQPNDIITKLDDYDIFSNTDLTQAKKNYSAGDEAKLTVYREGAYVTLTIIFDEERPNNT